MALVDYPCERCGFNTEDPEKGRHPSEYSCFQAVHRSAVADVKAQVIKAAETVSRQYGASGIPELDRLADAFDAFINGLANEQREIPRHYWVRIAKVETERPIDHALGRINEEAARAEAHRHVEHIYGANGTVALFDGDPKNEGSKRIGMWKV